MFLINRRNQRKRARDSQLTTDSLALTNIQNNHAAEDDKKSVTPSEHHSLAPGCELQSPISQDDMLKHTVNVSSIPERSNGIPYTSNVELDNAKREIYQLSGESQKVELGNTDTGYRFELAEERSLPVELSGESMKIEELASPTLGEEGMYVQLRALEDSKISRPENTMDMGRFGGNVASWENEWPATPETGVMMGFGPSDRNTRHNSTENRGSVIDIRKKDDMRDPNSVLYTDE